MDEKTYLKFFVLFTHFTIILVVGGLAFLCAWFGKDQFLTAILTGMFGYLSPQFLNSLTSDKGLTREEIIELIKESNCKEVAKNGN